MGSFKLEKIELDSDGIEKLLRSAVMKAEMQRHSDRALGSLGSGYAARVRDTGQRVAVNVYAATPEASQENLESNTILKAVL